MKTHAGVEWARLGRPRKSPQFTHTLWKLRLVVQER